MSQIKIEANPSGGGIYTLQSGAGSTDRTITLPDNTGTVITTESTVPPKIPMFHAQVASSFTISSGTTTDVVFGQENFDSDGWYDTSTGRFTPQTAGYYSISAFLGLKVTSSTISTANGWVQKNGVTSTVGPFRIILIIGSGSTEFYGGSTSIVYFNGSTDYMGVQIYLVAGGTREVLGTSDFANSFFCGHLLRAGSI
jgi:hypothetical protein